MAAAPNQAASTMAEEKIKVAIIGAGLAGCVLAHALSKHSHIESTIYEENPEFSGAHVGIGLTRNAQDALKMILGPQAAASLVHRASYTKVNNAKVKIVSECVPSCYLGDPVSFSSRRD